MNALSDGGIVANEFIGPNIVIGGAAEIVPDDLQYPLNNGDPRILRIFRNLAYPSLEISLPLGVFPNEEVPVIGDVWEFYFIDPGIFLRTKPDGPPGPTDMGEMIRVAHFGGGSWTVLMAVPFSS